MWLAGAPASAGRGERLDRSRPAGSPAPRPGGLGHAHAPCSQGHGRRGRNRPIPAGHTQQASRSLRCPGLAQCLDPYRRGPRQVADGPRRIANCLKKVPWSVLGRPAGACHEMNVIWRQPDTLSDGIWADAGGSISEWSSRPGSGSKRGMLNASGAHGATPLPVIRALLPPGNPGASSVALILAIGHRPCEKRRRVPNNTASQGLREA